MPFDGSGNFVRSFPAGGWAGDAAANIKILASRHDTHDNDLATGLTNALCKDGQSSPSADLKMNGKKLVNLGAPTTGTDAATKTYADSIRSFSSAITLTGSVPQATIGFTQSDIGFGTRVAGTPAGSLNRFVWNDKPDLSGTDIAIMDDTGRLSLRNAPLAATDSRSALTINGELSFNGGYSLCWNDYYDTVATSFKAIAAGYGGNLSFSQAGGVFSIVRSTASVAAGAALTMTNLLIIDPATGVTFPDTTYTYSNGGATTWRQNRANTVVEYKMSGGGAYTWNKSSTGLTTGATPTQLMSLDDGGSLTIPGQITTSQNYASSSAVAVLGCTGAGQVLLRPNGVGSGSGQASLVDDGTFTASIFASNNIHSPANNSNLTLSGGAVYNTGANIELYGPTSGFPNAMYFDATGHTWRTANGVTQLLALETNGRLDTTYGYACKPGTGGAFVANSFNFNYTTGIQCWIDTTNFGTITFTSDYRIKKDIAPLASQWDAVKGLRPCRYSIADYTPEGSELPLSVASDDEQWGFIAHEVQEDLLPTAANGSKDEANVLQSLNLPAIVSALTKALQEAMARIEVLEGRAK